MNSRGQIGIGMIVTLAMALIVGVILLQSSAQQVGSVTNTVSVLNESIGTATNGTAIYLTNYRAITSPILFNGSNGAVIASGNYTITNNVVYNGALAVQITPDADYGYYGYSWNISGTGQPLTYSNDAGARSMSSLIVIMAALALVIIAVGYAVKKEYFE